MDSKHGKKGARLHQPERASAPYHSQDVFIKSVLFFHKVSNISITISSLPSMKIGTRTCEPGSCRVSSFPVLSRLGLKAAFQIIAS